MDHSRTAIAGEEDILMTLAPKTSKGNTAILDGMPVVTILSGAGTFDIVDELNIKFHPTPVPDGVDTVFEIKGDRNPGPDQDFLIDTLTLTTAPALAVTLDATLSTVPA